MVQQNPLTAFVIPADINSSFFAIQANVLNSVLFSAQIRNVM